jgi:hypothetical protein
MFLAESADHGHGMAARAYRGSREPHRERPTDPGETMENTLIVLVTALAFLAGGLTATMAATWWSRHRHDEVRREPPREDAACRRSNSCCCTPVRR